MQFGIYIGCYNNLKKINKNYQFRVFGLLIIFAELKFRCIANYFQFLNGYCGMGMFLIL